MTLPVTQYTLARINLVKAACPFELHSQVANMGIGRVIVVEKNRKKFGYVEAADYFPPVVIVAGAETRSQLLKRGHIHGWALVENGAMEFSSREIMGAAEVLKMLNRALVNRFYPGGVLYAGQIAPVLLECHPFDGRVVYEMKGRIYAQRYAPDFIERRVELIGQPIDACGTGPMPRVQTGARYSPGTVYPALAVSNQGAPNSELVTGIIRDWTDIQEAVRMYLGASDKSHEVLRPRFEPVALKYDGKETVYRGDNLKRALVKAGIDPVDFAVWSADAQHMKTKSHSGTDVPMSKHAYVGNPKDPSTWHLPIDTPGRTKAALARINQTHGIPSNAKPRVLQKIRKAAKGRGMDVTPKPTPGQRKWAAQVEATT